MADEKISDLAMEKEPISLEEGTRSTRRGSKYTHDADEAMKAFEEGEIEVLDEATNKRLLRAIDFSIMPVGTNVDSKQ